MAGIAERSRVCTITRTANRAFRASIRYAEITAVDIAPERRGCTLSGASARSLG
jgi:hypothetical protein